MIARILRIAAVTVVVGILVVAGLTLFGPGPTAFAKGAGVELAAYRGPSPTGVPAELANADLVRRGEYLTRAADCEVCHTAKGGTPFAGGFAFVLPFGTIYSSNITADPETGIGRWTDAQFVAALHQGVRPDGQTIYPAMPYASFTAMTADDARAIKAYLFSLPKVRAPQRPNDLSWPFNQRALVGLWRWAFNSDERFRPHPEESPEWNRGAYLAEAMAHCGECHTPRNLGYALDNRRKYGGAVASGWRAHNISADANAGVGNWTPAALEQYLATGYASGHGVAAGPMGEVVDYSLKHLTAGDRRALVTYLRSVPAVVGGEARVTQPAPASYAAGPAAGAEDRRGERLFAASCFGCHGWTGTSPVNPQATLTGLASINDASAVNVAQVVIHGVHRVDAPDILKMPAFGRTLNDKEVAAVANYVTARFGAKGSRLDEADVRRMRRESTQPGPTAD